MLKDIMARALLNKGANMNIKLFYKGHEVIAKLKFGTEIGDTYIESATFSDLGYDLDEWALYELEDRNWSILEDAYMEQLTYRANMVEDR